MFSLPFFWVSCLYLLFWGGTYYAGAGPLAAVTTHTWLAFGLTALGALAWRSGKWLPLGGGLDAWLGPLALCLAIVSGLAPDRGRSLNAAASVFLLIGLFYGLVALARQRQVGLTQALVTVSGLAMAGAYLIPLLFPTYGGWQTVQGGGFLVWPLGHWNFMGSLFALMAPLPVALLAKTDKRLVKAALIALSGCMAFSAAVGGSRGALAAILVQAVVALAIWRLPKRIKWGIGLVTLLLGAGVLFVTPMGGKLARIPATAGELLAGRPVVESSLYQRFTMWQSALGHVTPFGRGLGSVPTQFPADQLAVPRFPSWGVPHLHNTYLHLIYEAGWVTFLVVAVLLGLLVRLAWRLRRMADASRRNIGLAAALGLLGYAVTLLTDFHWPLWGLTFPALAVAALLVASHEAPEPRRLPAWGAGILAAAIAVFFWIRWIPVDLALAKHFEATNAWAEGDRLAAVQAWKHAVDWAPDQLTGHLFLGMASDDPQEAMRELDWVNQRSHLFPALLKAAYWANREGDRPKAEALYASAHRINFYSVSPLWHWGVAMEDEAPLAKALAYAPLLMDAAFWRGREPLLRRVLAKTEAEVGSYVTRWPQHPETHYRHGRVLEKMGRVKEAEAAYQKALSLMGPVPNDENGNPFDRFALLDRRIEFRLGLVRYLMGDKPGAANWWTRSLSHGGPNPPAMWGLAKLEKDAFAGIVAADHLRTMTGFEVKPDDVADLSLFTFEMPLDKRDNWAMQSFKVPVEGSLFYRPVAVSGWAGFVTDEAKPFYHLPPYSPPSSGP